MAAERESMLIMKNVSKTFNPGTVNEKCALNGVNLTLGAGDFATIVGSNGAGKSTLFNAITGAFFPDRGLIMLGGEDITYQQEHVRSKVIGHLFQDPLKGTAPHMTIEENLALAYLRASKSGKGSAFSRISFPAMVSPYFFSKYPAHFRSLGARLPSLCASVPTKSTNPAFSSFFTTVFAAKPWSPTTLEAFT